jgi:hypothetical protein
MRVFRANNDISEHTGMVRDAQAIEYNSRKRKSVSFAKDPIPFSHLLSFKVPLNGEYTQNVRKISTCGEKQSCVEEVLK